jgi:hypothetical protein
MSEAAATNRALNRLCKWRSVLAGWHLGTRSQDAPGVQAMRSLMEFRLILRAEVNTIAVLLIDKGVFTHDEYNAQLTIEADVHERRMQQDFPGYRATDEGMTITPTVAAETNLARGFPP